MTTKLKARMVNQYVGEIFGGNGFKDPLLMKNLSQRTKYHLRTIGEQLAKESVRLGEQWQEITDRYTVEVNPTDGGEPTKMIPDEKLKEYEKEMEELNEIEIELTHYPLKEKDFIDSSTKEVVAGNGIYYNVIDLLVYMQPEQ